jgi:hypothetical protein
MNMPRNNTQFCKSLLAFRSFFCRIHHKIIQFHVSSQIFYTVENNHKKYGVKCDLNSKLKKSSESSENNLRKKWGLFKKIIHKIPTNL